METQSKVQTIKVLERADPAKQESLDSENVPDPMDAEQTWPTEEELKMAEVAQKVTLHATLPILNFLPLHLLQLLL